MKFLSLEKLLIIIFITVFSCGAGYVGDLPKFIQAPEENKQSAELKNNIPSDTNKQPTDLPTPPQAGGGNQPPGDFKKQPAPIMPLAPRDYPAMYEGAVIKQNKYTKYQKDINPLKDKLEMLKKTMQSNEDDKMQHFCAQVNLIDIYVNYVKVKYANKPERFYESYKTMLIMDKNIVDTANYWKTSMQYMRMIYKSGSERKRDQAAFKKKFDNSQKSVDKLLGILKEDLKKD